MTYTATEKPTSRGDRLICVRTELPNDIKAMLPVEIYWYSHRDFGLPEPFDHGTVIEIIRYREVNIGAETGRIIDYKIIPRTQKEEVYADTVWSSYEISFITFFTAPRAVLKDKMFLYEMSWKLPRYVRQQCRNYDEQTLPFFIEEMKRRYPGEENAG